MLATSMYMHSYTTYSPRTFITEPEVISECETKPTSASIKTFESFTEYFQTPCQMAGLCRGSPYITTPPPLIHFLPNSIFALQAKCLALPPFIFPTSIWS